MRKLVVATNNQGKVMEIKAILKDSYDEIYSLKDLGIEVDVEEDQDSFYGNAAKKAIEISKLVEGDVLADDSGLCVDALDGAPGIYSARFSGEDSTDISNNEKLMQSMKGKEDRNAQFVCALVLANGGKEILNVEGITRGVLLDFPKGSNGFGYDPLFFNEEYQKTFGELPADIKNIISHRARALAKLKKEVANRG